MKYHKNTRSSYVSFTMHVIEYCIYTYVFLYTLSNNDGLLRIRSYTMTKKNQINIYFVN